MANPGKMDRRISFEARTLSQDSMGGRTESWDAAFSAWAEIVNHKANETILSDADRSSDDRQFRIRYRPGIASGTHRISYQSRTYNISGVTEEGRQNTLLIDTRSIQAITHG